MTQEDYRGRWLLVFFGYTHCPDVCPTTMVDISLVLRRLGDDARHVQAIFITVDPERDDAKTIAAFVGAFGSDIVGLTGSTSAVRDAADSFRAYFRKVDEERGPDAYLMEHQATVYLLDRRGKLKTVFTPGFAPDNVVDTLRQLFEEEA
ncbi:MAG: SCO family protein [Aestuariibacter sp.]|nr:SCO family protein [Aestuariibacter sp.]